MSASIADAIAGGFERVTVNGTEYLAHDVVAQREGVYYYPDPEGGVQRELVPAEELKDSIEGVEEAEVLIRHPDAPEGEPKLTKNPRANYVPVGKWDDLRETNDGEGVAGRVLIRVNELDEHDGDLRQYINQVAQTGTGEVSTGYDLTGIERDTGRYNGQAYDAIQRGIQLDHLALLPDAQGDCAVADGCGLGRANKSSDELVRTNNHFPQADDAQDGGRAEDGGVQDIDSLLDGDLEEQDKSTTLRELGRRTASMLGLESLLGGSGGENEMKDQEKIDALVEEYGLDRENVDHLAGEDCLDRIYKQFSEQEGRNNDNMGDNPDDDPDNDNPDNALTEKQREEINSIVEDQTPSAEDIAEEIEVPEVEVPDQEEIVEKVVDQTTDQVKQARANEQEINALANHEEVGLEREVLERMNEDVVSDLYDDHFDEEDAGSRQNFAGRATGASFDETEHRNNEENEYADQVPTAGGRSLAGDDE